MKIGAIPCRKSREGSAPCSNEALAHATIRGSELGTPARGHQHVYVVAKVLWGQGIRYGTSIHLSAPMQGKSQLNIAYMWPVNSARKACSISSTVPESKLSNCESGKRLQRCPFSPVEQWWVRGTKDDDQASIEFRMWLSDQKNTLSLFVGTDPLLRIDHLRVVSKFPSPVQRMLLGQTLPCTWWKSCKVCFLLQVSSFKESDWKAITVQ